jgi:DNA polymerase phi
MLASNNSKSCSIVEFWTLIEEHFFSSSHERKFMGFQIFSLILPNVTAEQVPLIFTPHFMRCLINSLSSKEAFLNKQARQTTTTLLELAQERPQIALPLVMQLLGKYGHFKFDSLTKTKTVEGILASLTLEGTESFISYLTSIFFTPSLLAGEKGDDDARGHEGARLWAVEQLYLLIRTSKIVKNQRWVLKVITFMIAYGFFNILSKDGENIKPLTVSAVVQVSLREKVVSSLGYLHSIVLKDGEKVLPAGELANGKTWTITFAEVMSSMQNNKKVYSLIGDTSDDRLKALKSAFAMISEIETAKMSADEAKKMELKAFQSLFAHLFVILHSDSQESTDVIQVPYANVNSRNYEIVINLCFQRNLLKPKQTKSERLKMRKRLHFPLKC